MVATAAAVITTFATRRRCRVLTYDFNKFFTCCVDLAEQLYIQLLHLCGFNPLTVVASCEANSVTGLVRPFFSVKKMVQILYVRVFNQKLEIIPDYLIVIGNGFNPIIGVADSVIGTGNAVAGSMVATGHAFLLSNNRSC